MAVDQAGVRREGVKKTLDRWCMTPALAEPELIVSALRAIDPMARAAMAAAAGR